MQSIVMLSVSYAQRPLRRVSLYWMSLCWMSWRPSSSECSLPINDLHSTTFINGK